MTRGDLIRKLVTTPHLNVPAGRKPKGERAGVTHHGRPDLLRTGPVHVTLRVLVHVWNLRFHAHVLRTPAETRNALAYVLLNHRSHLARIHKPVRTSGPDPFSSAAAFDGWREAPPEPARVTPPPRSWLLRSGWRRRGRLSLCEIPAAPG